MSEKEQGFTKGKTENELIELGLRQPHLDLDQSVFKKTQEEKLQLKAAKKEHKELKKIKFD